MLPAHLNLWRAGRLRSVFFVARKNRGGRLGALRCAGAELLGDFYFEKIKILLPKNASDEKIFLRFEKIFWG